MSLDALKYPIGTFVRPEAWTEADLKRAMYAIETLPERLKSAVAGWDDARLDTPYRPDGWTVRQVVHHLADSHMNIFIRVKLALTEDTPTIKPYEEGRWAQLPDSLSLAISPSLHLLEGVHARWVALMRTFSEADWARGFFHPEHQTTIPLHEAAFFYAWHGDHHLAHIQNLARRLGWKKE